MALERVPGVDSANVSYEAGRAIVGFDPAVTSPDQFIAELERMTGFTADVTTGALEESVLEESVDETVDANDMGKHDHAGMDHEVTLDTLRR